MKTALATFAIIILFNYVNAQDLTITGKVMVIDSKGSILSGASVSLKGSDYYVKSDESGNYSLSFPTTGKDTLVFSYIGFENKEIALRDQKTIDVILTESAIKKNSNEVVAYGIIKKAPVDIAVNIPNAYKDAEDDSIEIPNGYKGDNCVEIPDAGLKADSIPNPHTHR